MEFYIPQLVSLLCNRKPYSQSLDRFVVDKCSQSMHLALKFYWYLSSVVEDDDPWNKEVAANLKGSIEMAVVNGGSKGEASVDEEAMEKVRLV